MREEVSCQKNFFWLNNLAILCGLVFLILVFFIDQRGVSDKHCLLSFFSLKPNFIHPEVFANKIGFGGLSPNIIAFDRILLAHLSRRLTR